MKGIELNKEDLCASFQDVVVDSLTTKTMRAIDKYNVKNLILAGGVAANRGIRERFTEIFEGTDINFSYPDIKYCTDNATMIAAAGYFMYMDGKFSKLDINAISSQELI